MTQALQTILDRTDVWRAGKGLENKTLPAFKSGFRELDHALPFGGWPLGALSELLTEQPGEGEMQLLLPALARISQQQWVVMIAPPYIPYAPMLAQAGVNLANVLLVRPKDDREALWAMEQALMAGCCGAVLAWPKRIDMGAMRRLQLAAEAGEGLAILLRSTAKLKQSSPATLRLAVSSESAWLKLDVIKCRGGVAPMQMRLPLSSAPYQAYAAQQTAKINRNTVAKPAVAATPEPTQMALPLNALSRSGYARRRRHAPSTQVVA